MTLRALRLEPKANGPAGGRPGHKEVPGHGDRLGGKPLRPPKDAERFVVDGLAIRAYKDGRRDVVTFRRHGRTCVLAGIVHFRSTLLKLASWKGGGAVTF